MTALMMHGNRIVITLFDHLISMMCMFYGLVGWQSIRDSRPIEREYRSVLAREKVMDILDGGIWREI